MSPVNYAEFQLQDFLEDDFFIQWVINPNINSDSFWQSFMDQQPGKRDMIIKASDMIRIYRDQPFYGNETNKDSVWQKITNSVDEAATKRRVFRIPVLFRVAAAVIIVMTLAFFLYQYYQTDQTMRIATAAGEVRKVVLPDQSVVTLNGNTILTYAGKWDDASPREVWVNGEAYFDVKHLNKDSLQVKASEKFVVHCGDVNIEVLGTTFNVKSRSGKTNIALLTGSIRLEYVNKKATPHVMTPGDYIEYAGQEIKMIKKISKPAQVISWTNTEEISFSDATLREITETLENRFGYTVNAMETTLYELKIEGDITVSNVADLLDVIATALDVRIEQTANKHITISK